MDPKLIIFAVAAAFVGLYMAWDAGLFKAIRLPWFGERPPSAAEAMAHCKGLAAYLQGTGTATNATHAEQVKNIATEIYRKTLH